MCLLVYSQMADSSRILKHPEEYDDCIPNVTLAQFVLDKAKEFGDDVACVRMCDVFLFCAFEMRECENCSINHLPFLFTKD